MVLRRASGLMLRRRTNIWTPFRRRFAQSTRLPPELKPLGLIYLETDQLRKEFDRFNESQTGAISIEEARNVLIVAGHKDASENDAQALVASLDTNQTGAIEWDEFKEAVDQDAQPIDKRIYPLSASLFANFVGQGAAMLVLPLLGRSYGLLEGQIGLVNSVAPFVRLTLNLPAAALADKARRPCVTGGPAISAIGFGALACSSTFPAMILGTAIVGAGSALTVAGNGLYSADISTPKNRAKTNAPTMYAALGGMTIGPALGGFLCELDIYYPFYVSSAALFGASLICALNITETKPANTLGKKEESSTINAIKHTLSNRKLLGLNTCVFSLYFERGSITVVGTLFAIDHIGMTPSMLGSMFTAWVFVMSAVVWPITKISDKKKGNRHTILIPAFFASGCFQMCIPYCDTVLPYVSVSLCGALCAGCIYPNITAYILDYVEPEHRAGALAFRNTVQDLGMILGGGAMGIFAQQFGLGNAITFSAAMSITSSGILAWCSRNTGSSDHKVK